MDDIRYPTGKFSPNPKITEIERADLIDQIGTCPGQVRNALSGLTEAQLDTPYRDGGWTVRQVVHHLPDSHMNAYVRFKLAMTENGPTIKPYEEHLWAELIDGRTGPVETSLVLLDSLHRRWTSFLRHLTPVDFERQFIHPESGRQNLDWLLQLYAWHGRHHTAHITTFRSRKGW